MGLTMGDAPSTFKRELIPAGGTQGVCIGVVDFGTQYNKVYDKLQRKIYIVWELPDARMDITVDDEEKSVPKWKGKEYTLSSDPKANLRKDLESWRGRGFLDSELNEFDIFSLIGVNCMLNIMHSTNEHSGVTYDNINGITPLYKGIPKLEPESKTFTFSIDDLPNIPDEVPAWMVEKKIMQSKEFADGNEGVSAGKEYVPPKPTVSVNEDDIPF